MTEEGDVGKSLMEMASPSSFAKQTPTPKKQEADSKYNPYPAPLARYEDVVASSKLFMTTLKELHAVMATKFMIPIIGGKELDLHQLFVEVTSRGGIEKIIQLKRWKEVTAIFNFPSTATNASFVLRKYYLSLLHHYEQIYYFKANCWINISSDPLRSPSAAPILIKGIVAVAAMSPAVQSAAMPQQRIVTVTPALSKGSPITGIIDGKFESGYLVTISNGSEVLKGVLYQNSENPAEEQAQPNNTIFSISNDNNNNAASSQPRRKRRKKSEIKRRDPAHPKPNRSGYNFFFSEQHARLKLLHPGKDRAISRMIGELWTKLKEGDRSVYQEKAIKDKERYQAEMETYRERLRIDGEIVSDAVPIQQRFPDSSDLNMAEADVNVEETESLQTLENENNSDQTSDSESEKTPEKVLDMKASPRNVDMETSAGEISFNSKKRTGESADETIGDDVPGKKREKISTE